MCRVLLSLISTQQFGFRSRATLLAEILALRQQINVLMRSAGRPRVRSSDRLLWIWLTRIWPDWRSAVLRQNLVRE